MPARVKAQPPPRIRIERAAPTVDGGRYPVKRTQGDIVAVSADVLRDGHEALRACVRWRGPGDRRWREAPLRHVDGHHGGVRWEGSFGVDELGTTRWTIVAWVDLFAGWRDELRRKLDAGQIELASELAEGQALIERAAQRAGGRAAKRLAKAAKALAGDPAGALDLELLGLVEQAQERSEEVVLEPVLEVDVDRSLARFGSWYELFPRSWGGFDGVRAQLPRLAELGFDVLYLPPIHPIGVTNRKGANNALAAGAGDPGSPWAIGGPEGGHEAIHPELGTFEDFDRLVVAAREHGIDVALDLAIQCSADHPWLTEHPEWFHHRPDGTLKYAENPPKRYQDIYNVNWASENWRGLWDAVLALVRHWGDHGVTTFRVDNPHTKPLPFWQWLIAKVRRDHPETIFLAEAFTHRAMMRELAKVGFSQSYTYFTWKSTRWELREYVDELAHGEEREYFRPNFFANTPDILTEQLQRGGPAAFASRLVLASTLSPSYGIYSGFEHHERVARPGSEEYLDNEKYEIKQRALDGPLLGMIGRLNAIRRANRALQRLENITFLDAGNGALLAYVKRERANIVICVVNLDPQRAHEGLVQIPAVLGLPDAFTVTELLTVQRFDWRAGANYVRLDPTRQPGADGIWPGVAHVLRVDTP